MEFDSNHTSDIFQDDFGMKQWERRHAKTTEILDMFGAKKILDFGCSDGRLIRRLTRDENIELIALENSQPEIYHYLKPKDSDTQLKILLFQADITKDLQYLLKYEIDAIASVEVLEHLPREDIDTYAHNIFGVLNPKYVVLTTPNYNFNYWFDPTQKVFPFRHWDHKFEMTQQEFEEWCLELSKSYKYRVEFDGVGIHQSGDMSHGYCSQFAIFQKDEEKADIIIRELPQQTESLFGEVNYPKKKKIDKSELMSNEIIYYFHQFESLGDEEELNLDQDYQYINYVPLTFFLKRKEILKYVTSEEDLLKFVSTTEFKDYTLKISPDQKKIYLISNEEENDE